MSAESRFPLKTNEHACEGIALTTRSAGATRHHLTAEDAPIKMIRASFSLEDSGNNEFRLDSLTMD